MSRIYAMHEMRPLQRYSEQSVAGEMTAKRGKQVHHTTNEVYRTVAN